MTRDDEIVNARRVLAEALSAYDAARRGADMYDTYKLMQLQSAVAEADRRLGALESKREAAGEPLRSSSAIFFGSDH